MADVVRPDQLVNHFLPEALAKSLVADALPGDLYVIFDVQYSHWKNQCWCDHNIFGFYPSSNCIVYSLQQVKDELKVLEEAVDDS